jgi:hypothetical protein
MVKARKYICPLPSHDNQFVPKKKDGIEEETGCA